MRRYLLILLLLTGTACADVITLTDGFLQQSLNYGLEYRLGDDSEAPSDWTTNTSPLSFGFDRRPLWIRFNVKNTGDTAKSLMLEIENPLLDSIDLYRVTDNQPQLLYAIGDTRPLTAQPLRHQNPVMPLRLEPAEELQLLMRIQTSGSLNVPMTLWEPQAFTGRSLISLALQCLLFGSLLGIAIYQFMVFIQLREIAFLQYALFILFTSFILASFQGIPSAYLWPEIREYNDSLVVASYALAVIFALAFINNILGVKASRPRYALASRLVSATALLMLFLTPFISYATMIRGMTVIGAMTVIIVIMIQLRRMLDKNVPAYYSGSATTFAGAGIMILILDKAGVIPSSALTRAAADVGILAMVVFYALALSQRINREQTLRMEAQRATMQAQKKLLKTQRELNRNLDILVQERTHELESANEKLRRLSMTDPLTGLSNRRHFDELFAELFRKAQRDQKSIGLMFIDLDHFKQINDTYGHPFGDICLTEVAQRINQSVRSDLDIAARLGGEEFVVLMPETSPTAAQATAGRIADALRTMPVISGELKCTMTASFGLVCVIPDASCSAATLMQRADDLLYAAKKNGRNRIEFAQTHELPEA